MNRAKHEAVSDVPTPPTFGIQKKGNISQTLSLEQQASRVFLDSTLMMLLYV